MAGTSRANLLQTSINAATQLVVAAVNNGIVAVQGVDELNELVIKTANPIFERLLEEPVTVPNEGGGFRSGSGGSREISASDARSIVINWGKFKDQTLGDVFEMSASRAEEFGYTTGPGRTYIEWLANNKDPKKSFLQKRAQAIINEARAGSNS